MNTRELKKWRREQFLSQTNLANLLGVHYTTVANWESGRTEIPGMAVLAFEAITQQRATQVRKLRAAHEELAHKRRLKAIAQGLKDEATA